MSGNKESIINDHRFFPDRAWFDRCVACGYAESAHAETSLPDSRFPDGHDELPYRCPNCVTTGADTCEHARTTPYQELKIRERYIGITPTGERLLNELDG